MGKYIKGLNKDTAPIDQPEGSYRYAKNILSNETAGALSNEPGNKSVSDDIAVGHRVIGSIEVTDDTVVLFTTNNVSNHHIYVYTASTNAVNLILRTEPAINPNSFLNPGGSDADFDLKFSWEYPIEGTYKFDPDGNLIVYWTDNNNPPRSLNVTRQRNESTTARIYGVNPFTSPNKNYIDRLNLFPHAGPVPRISFNTIASGGALKSGTYTLFLAYVDKNFTQTNFVSYSLAVPIVEDDEGVKPIERYDGCEPGTQTGKSIVWEASNLNTDYEFLRPIVVYRTLDKEGAPAEFAFKLNDVDISGNTGTIVFSGLEGYESASVEDTIIDTVAYDTAKTLTQLDSVLYIGNLTGTKDVGYQPFANFIKVNAVAGDTFEPFDAYELSSDNLEYGYLNTEPDPTIVKNMGFRDVDKISSRNQNRRSYFRDEVYAFYIAFILNDGSMSYAYHIPGRSPITVADGSLVRKVGINNPLAGSTSEDDDLEDPDLINLTQNQGKLFHFHDFSIFGGARNMNFWENKNEFYPNTDDYLMIDANNPGVTVEDLRGSNVRHHHMPCNTNSDMRTIVSNTGNFQPNTSSQTFTYYFHVGAGNNGDGPNNAGDGEGCLSGGDTGAEADLVIASQDPGVPVAESMGTDGINTAYDNSIDDIEDAYGPANTWLPNIPSEGQNGYFVWSKTNNNFGGAAGGATATIQSNDGTTLVVNQTGSLGYGDGQLNGGYGQVQYAMFVWQDVVPAITQNGTISQEVRPLGVRFQDIKIPKNIADKVQGFRIYYAERKHENRRILGQDVLKRTFPIDDVNISGCGTDLGTSTSEDFILSPGALYGGLINSATFHDFYLLNSRNSLVPATHTSWEYRVDMLSFLGPGHEYVEEDDLSECQYKSSFVALHMGQTYIAFTANAVPFYHYPLREKCKTYLNGDSIYDGRSIGFGKRVHNVGGESSILLGFNPTRRPFQLGFPDVFSAGWHDIPSLGAGFSYPTVPDQAQLNIHNLNAFKTDMYLSYDTQELVWTGFEVLGDDLARYTVEENGVSTIGATHSTGNIFGGDTFICRHGYRITHRPGYAGTDPHDHKSLIYVISESTDNINFRHETDVDSSYFPGSPAKKILDLKANIDLTKKDNMNYDESFSLGIADIKPAIPYPLREADPSIFKTRVQRSAKADNTSLVDNYRVHLALQFKDLPRNRGDLWKLISLNNLLYLHTEDSLFRTKGKQSLQMSDGTESFVGSGDIFQQEPDEVIQTKFGYGGTQSQWVSLVTKHGYFCLDYRNRRVFLFKDQLYDIGKTGLESWFQDNIPHDLEEYGLLPGDYDNPILGIGFHAMYDERYDRIILTKRDLKPSKQFLLLYNQGNIKYDSTIKKFRYGQTIVLEYTNDYYFTSTGWTVSYDVELNVWVSFHDYIPYKYTRSADNLTSFEEDYTDVWVHNDELNRGNFYGKDHSSEFEFIYNSAKNADKTFYSFEYMIDVYNTSNVLIHDQGFSSFYIYNTHQISDEQDIEYMINTRRIGNAWKINKFRDLADLVNTPVVAGAGSNFGVPGASVAGTNIASTLTSSTAQTMFNVEGMTESINNAFINAAKPWNQQRKFTDKWVGIRLKYDNVTKKLINLYSTDVAAKKFYR